MYSTVTFEHYLGKYILKSEALLNLSSPPTCRVPPAVKTNWKMSWPVMLIVEYLPTLRLALKQFPPRSQVPWEYALIQDHKIGCFNSETYQTPVLDKILYELFEAKVFSNIQLHSDNSTNHYTMSPPCWAHFQHYSEDTTCAVWFTPVIWDFSESKKLSFRMFGKSRWHLSIWP